MLLLYVLTGLFLLLSLILDRGKTQKAIKIAWKKFINIMPSFIIMLMLVSITLYLFPDKLIVKYLGGENIYKGTFLGSILGSITLMPGFIVFPLSGILLKKGVSYMVLSSFSTTLMMVGIITFPIESEYFGTKLSLARNVLSYFIALIVAAAVGILYGEVIL